MKKGTKAGDRRKKCRMIAAAVFAALVTAVLAGNVSGSEVFAKLKSNLDITRKGSITLTLKDPNTKKGMPGIGFELIRIASVIQDDDGNYRYVYTDDFKECRTDLKKLSEKDMGARDAAALMEAHAADHNITGTQKTTDAAGKVRFPDLEPGVFLVLNNPASPEGTTISSFLVTVPRLLKNEYVYDVDATAKPEVNVETEKKTEKQKNESDPSGSSAGNGGRLPQTGQLWWPVPVLAAAGLILIILGIARRRRG